MKRKLTLLMTLLSTISLVVALYALQNLQQDDHSSTSSPITTVHVEQPPEPVAITVTEPVAQRKRVAETPDSAIDSEDEGDPVATPSPEENFTSRFLDRVARELANCSLSEKRVLKRWKGIIGNLKTAADREREYSFVFDMFCGHQYKSPHFYRQWELLFQEAGLEDLTEYDHGVLKEFVLEFTGIINDDATAIDREFGIDVAGLSIAGDALDRAHDRRVELLSHRYFEMLDGLRSRVSVTNNEKLEMAFAAFGLALEEEQ